MVLYMIIGSEPYQKPHVEKTVKITLTTQSLNRLTPMFKGSMKEQGRLFASVEQILILHATSVGKSYVLDK